MPRKRARSRFIEDEAEVDDAEPAADDAAAEEDGVLDGATGSVEASSSSQGEELDELPVYHKPVAPAPPPRCWRCGTTTQDGGLFTREGEKRKCPRCRNTWWVPPQKPPQK